MGQAERRGLGEQERRTKRKGQESQGYIGMRSWGGGGEDHELEKLRVWCGMKRAEKNQSQHGLCKRCFAC